MNFRVAKIERAAFILDVNFAMLNEIGDTQNVTLKRNDKEHRTIGQKIETNTVYEEGDRKRGAVFKRT